MRLDNLWFDGDVMNKREYLTSYTCNLYLIQALGLPKLLDQNVPGALHDLECDVVSELMDEMDHFGGEEIGDV